jgi:hypothetical protein
MQSNKASPIVKTDGEDDEKRGLNIDLDEKGSWRSVTDLVLRMLSLFIKDSESWQHRTKLNTVKGSRGLGLLNVIAVLVPTLKFVASSFS